MVEHLKIFEARLLDNQNVKQETMQSNEQLIEKKIKTWEMLPSKRKQIIDEPYAHNKINK